MVIETEQLILQDVQIVLTSIPQGFTLNTVVVIKVVTVCPI